MAIIGLLMISMIVLRAGLGLAGVVVTGAAAPLLPLLDWVPTVRAYSVTAALLCLTVAAPFSSVIPGHHGALWLFLLGAACGSYLSVYIARRVDPSRNKT